jgi:hypothetical protein
MMSRLACREPSAHARGQLLFAAVRHQRRLALQHVDKFVLA